MSTDAPGLLVVTDSWLPGWSARVDDVVTPIHRGNYAQRVIPIFRPGRHTIAMIYQPPGFALGPRDHGPVKPGLGVRVRFHDVGPPRGSGTRFRQAANGSRTDPKVDCL